MPGEGVVGIMRRRPNGIGRQFWSFGDNSSGELADSTTINRSSPVQNFSGGNNWASVDCKFASNGIGIKTDGTLWMWGNNSFGQLGINAAGYYTQKSSPVQTITVGTNWVTASCGSSSILATKKDGTLWAWGQNYTGQLGDNTTVNKSSPVQVFGFATTWSSVSSGGSHSAGIKTDGTLWCWGFNGSGQLGDNTTTHRSSPVQTTAFGTNWSQVSCGAGHTAAIKTDGTLWCWGSSNAGFSIAGQLGDNATVHRSSPVQTAAFGTNWKQVSCGAYHTAAIKTDGTLWLWGYNYYGQLGDNTRVRKSSPVQIIGGGNTWTSVSCGSYHTAAIKADFSLWSWGWGTTGNLGVNSATTTSSPVQSICGGWLSISAGTGNSMGIRYGDYPPFTPTPTPAFTPSILPITNGYLFDWGRNTNGQLGDNTTTHRSSPVQTIATATNLWWQASCGDGHTVGLRILEEFPTDPYLRLFTWGNNTNGQLGDNTTTHRSSPVQIVGGGGDWVQVGAGYRHTTGVKTDGTLWCWGNNTNGQLGDDTTTHRSSPVQIAAGWNDWVQVFCGNSHTIAQKTNASLWCWGLNADGQLGDNTVTPRSSPVQTTAFGTNWKYMSCGKAHTAAIKTDGTLWSWGNNSYGQIGDNTITHRSSPIQTTAFGTSWSRVSCGGHMTVATKTDGTLWCWGRNTNGQLGDNTTTHRSSPVQTVIYGTNWVSVMGGYKHTCAINSGNDLHVWGENTYGQVGDNTVVSKSYPVNLIYGTFLWLNVYSGPAANHTVALLNANTTPTPSPTPTPVPSGCTGSCEWGVVFIPKVGYQWQELSNTCSGGCSCTTEPAAMPTYSGQTGTTACY